MAILPLRSLEAIVPKGNGPLSGVAVPWQMSSYPCELNRSMQHHLVS